MGKQKDNKPKAQKSKLNLALIGAAVFVVAVIVLYGSGILNPIMQNSGFESLQEKASREKAFEEQRKPQRESYGISMKVFEDLPPIPEDFGTMAYMLETGRWKDLEYFTEAYYKQPEFYPLFTTAGLKWWKTPDTSSWGVVGWGAYPADVWAETYAGAEFSTKTFWHTGWGVQTFQGFQLMPTFPASSQDERGTTFNTQEPAAVSKYFTVSFGEKIFLLGPTYPKFSEDWAKAVTIKVQVAPETPKGDYVIGIDAGLPPEEYRSKWLLDYKMQYFDAASGSVSINRPHYRIIVKVK